MIDRYTRPKMGAIWTDENRYKAWLEVEILADEAWAELGEIPKEDVQKIRENASFDVARILEIEAEKLPIYVMMLSLLLVPFQKRLVKSENGCTMG